MAKKICVCFLLCLGIFHVHVCKGQGAVMVVGLDTEYGNRPSNTTHGSIATWANIITNALLVNVTNGKTDILVIGGGKDNGNQVKDFWNQVSTTLGRTVHFKHRKFFWNSVADVNNVNFENYALVVVANSVDGTGRLHKKELDVLNNRQQDLRKFLCNGGAIFASACDLENPYGYLSIFGSISSYTENSSDITPTITGTAMGISNTNLDIGPWHVAFSGYPGYLVPLAVKSGTTTVLAIGGQNLGTLKAAFTLPKTEFCLDEEIVANAGISNGAGRFFWSLQESDASWNRYGPELTEWFNGAPAAFNVSQWASQRSFSFKCNTYYRLKLAVSGICSDWKDTTLLIRISCPPVNAGPDICCTKYPGSFTIGSTGVSGMSYQWTPATGLSNTTIANPQVSTTAIQGQTPVQYIVTATNQKGCKARDTMRVFCGPPRFEINKQKRGCCDHLLTIQGSEIGDITWSTGATNTTSIVVSQAGTYTATVTNACGSLARQIIVTPVDAALTGPVADIIVPDAFTPDGDGNNDYFQLFHFGTTAPAIGAGPAYNAKEYRLTIFDRFGGAHIVASSGENCNGFINGEIKWDGKINGSLVQPGVYNYLLELKNCRVDKWVTPVIYHAKYVCVSCKFGFLLFDCGFFKTCKEYQLTHEVLTTQIGSVTVVL